MNPVINRMLSDAAKVCKKLLVVLWWVFCACSTFGVICAVGFMLARDIPFEYLSTLLKFSVFSEIFIVFSLLTYGTKRWYDKTKLIVNKELSNRW